MTAERDYLVRRARERDAFLWTGYNLGGGKCVLHLCSILGDTILCVIARGPSYTRRASILIPFGKNAPVARQLCKLQSLNLRQNAGNISDQTGRGPANLCTLGYAKHVRWRGSTRRPRPTLFNQPYAGSSPQRWTPFVVMRSW